MTNTARTCLTHAAMTEGLTHSELHTQGVTEISVAAFQIRCYSCFHVGSLPEGIPRCTTLMGHFQQGPVPENFVADQVLNTFTTVTESKSILAEHHQQ